MVFLYKLNIQILILKMYLVNRSNYLFNTNTNTNTNTNNNTNTNLFYNFNTINNPIDGETLDKLQDIIETLENNNDNLKNENISLQNTNDLLNNEVTELKKIIDTYQSGSFGMTGDFSTTKEIFFAPLYDRYMKKYGIVIGKGFDPLKLDIIKNEMKQEEEDSKIVS